MNAEADPRTGRGSLCGEKCAQTGDVDEVDVGQIHHDAGGGPAAAAADDEQLFERRSIRNVDLAANRNPAIAVRRIVHAHCDKVRRARECF